MDSQWLKIQFQVNPDKSKADLARMLNLGAPAVSKIIAGTRQIKAAEYAKMRHFFGLPVDGERAVTEGHSHLYRIDPLQNVLQEPDVLDNAPNDSWMIPASFLKGRTKAQPEDIKIFAVQEKAMAPDFVPGEHILVDLSDRKPSPPGVFVVSDGLGHIIRRCTYIPQSNPPSVRLSSSSDQYDDYVQALDETAIIGRIIAKLSWV